MVSGIYQILNRANGKCYIGSSMNLAKRWGDHLRELRRGQHYNRHLQAAFDKHGEKAFSLEVLERVEPANLITREQHYLDMLRPEYNIAQLAGSCLGCRRSKELRGKISKALTGRHLSEEHRSNISQALRGRELSEEHRRNLSEALIGERSHNYGKHLSAETRSRISRATMGQRPTLEARKKMSKARIGKHLSEQTRRKMSEANRGKTLSKEHKHKISESMKAYWQTIRTVNGT